MVPTGGTLLFIWEVSLRRARRARCAPFFQNSVFSFLFSPAVVDGQLRHDEALQCLVAAGVAAVDENALVRERRGFVGVSHFSVDREPLFFSVENATKKENAVGRREKKKDERQQRDEERRVEPLLGGEKKARLQEDRYIAPPHAREAANLQEAQPSPPQAGDAAACTKTGCCW